MNIFLSMSMIWIHLLLPDGSTIWLHTDRNMESLKIARQLGTIIGTYNEKP